jgi:O-antigen/teichoic acid export membrane protein
MLPMPMAPSLRSNFAWTFAGNAVYAAGQWAILSLIAKLGSGQMLGEYALALAVTAPVLMLSHLNLRAVIATDAAARRAFGDYLAVRLAATAAGLLAIAAIAFYSAQPRLAIIILAAGVAQSAENVSDTFYGGLQLQERMDRIARSMMVRAGLSALALGAALWWTRSLPLAVVALALARVSTLLLYDARSVGRPAFTGLKSQLAILRAAIPLGLVLMLATLTTNLPRYAIERYLGTRELGGFAAVAGFMTAGNTIINALGQSATPRLARYFADRDHAAFRGLVLRLSALAIALGAAAVAGAALLGAPLLRLLYRAEYGSYAGLLTGVMAAAIPVYLAGTLGYVITSVRAFDAQLPLFCVVAASCAAASALLIPRYGLKGAPMALAVAASVQAAGELGILALAFRRRERSS